MNSTWSSKSILVLHRLFSGENRLDDVPMTTLASSGRRDSLPAHHFNEEADDAEHHL